MQQGRAVGQSSGPWQYGDDGTETRIARLEEQLVQMEVHTASHNQQFSLTLPWTPSCCMRQKANCACLQDQCQADAVASSKLTVCAVQLDLWFVINKNNGDASLMCADVVFIMCVQGKLQHVLFLHLITQNG